MLNLFLDHVEDSLQEQCEDFIDETNKQVDLLLGTVELDRVSTTGKLLREGLGIRKIEKDYGLMMYLRQSLYRKGYEKEASNLIRKFSTESTENLVSNNYLERLVGLIQVRDQQEL